MKNWEKEFDNNWNKLDHRTGIIYGSNGSRVVSDNFGQQLPAIKMFVKKALEEQKKEFLNQPANEHDQAVRKNLLKELGEEIKNIWGKDGGDAIVIIKSHEGGVTQRPGLEDILKLINK